MGSVKVRYYTLRTYGKRTFGYWQPTKPMREAGFALICCGENGPRAWAIAEEWNRKWDSWRETGDVRPWPRGSIGEAYDAFRLTRTWAQKKPRTREDWKRGFRYILEWGLAETSPVTVDLNVIDQWYADTMEKAGVREAWRAMKIWRALWVAMRALKYVDGEDPSLGVRRQTPVPRQALWREPEVTRLVKNAVRRGYPGLACITAIAWDAALSPVDARKLTFGQMQDTGEKIVFRIERAKTGRAAIATLSKRTTRLVRAYVASLPGEHLQSAAIFRHRGGLPYSKDTLGDDFREVRGEGETRQLADMRRSAAVEALGGGAHAAAIASKLANQLHTNEDLHRTYLPTDLGAVEAVDQARIAARRKNNRGTATLMSLDSAKKGKF